MRRCQRSERGATAVIVAVMLVALLGFSAIAIDVGATWWDRKQAQNGADAAALAIAQDCAAGNCGAPNTTAQDYAAKNRNADQAFAGTATVDSTAGQVTALVSTTRQHWLAPLIGVSSTNVSAQARAAWGYPAAGTTLPLAFSLCEFWWQTGAWSGNPPPAGTPLTIDLMTKDAPSSTPVPLQCGTQAAHNEAAGGFGWLSPTTTSPNCLAESTVDGWVFADPGGSPPCSLNLVAGQTVQIPLFYEYRGQGSNAEYHLKGYAAITIVGWCFSPNTDEFNSDGNCNANNRHLRGTFVSFVDLGSTSTSPTAPNFGASTVNLIG